MFKCSSLSDAECSFESSASDIVPLSADRLRVMTTLATLLHISDLHFGSLAPSASTPAWWQTLKIFQGLLGHHHKATTQLRRFIGTTRAGVPTGQLFQLIVTGDLTSTGRDDQFDHASRFLSDPAWLAEPGWREYSVSGNHDQWGGSWPAAAAPTAGLTTTFPAGFPQVKTPIPLVDGFCLRFVLLDTDADVAVSRARMMNRSRSSMLPGMPSKLRCDPSGNRSSRATW